MFGPSGYSAVEQGSGHLIVAAPGTSLFGAGWVVGFLAGSLLLAFLIAGSVRRNSIKLAAKYPQLSIPSPAKNIRLIYRITPAAGIVAALFFYAVGYTSGSITLDRSTNTAALTARMTAFLPAQHRTVALQSVTGATLDEKPNSRRIRLEVSGGHDLAFPIWTDRPGQEEAVDAINRFLQSRTQGPQK